MINTNSVRMKILVPYLILILCSLLISGAVFNIAIKFYISREIKTEILKYAEAINKIAHEQPPPLNPLFRDYRNNNQKSNSNNDSIDFRTMIKISRFLGPKRFLNNINHTIIDNDSRIIFPREDNSTEYGFIKNNLLPIIKNVNEKDLKDKVSILRYSGIRYMVTPVEVNNIGIGKKMWVVLYADLSQLQNLQNMTTAILLFILFITALIAVATAITISAKITKPLTDLCSYAHTIGERNFEKRTFVGTSSEIEELANSMTTMSQKLEKYDTAQKTFLQNASHELRTPLMSIQGYAEGIKLGVLDDNDKAADIIIDESKRLTRLVENILYLTRLDTLLGFYQMKMIVFNDIIINIIEKTKGIALKEGKEIQINLPEREIIILGDEDKLSRAFINIVGNCLRYAKSYVNIVIELELEKNLLKVIVSDDGHGFDDKDLENLFVRFYKGRDGIFGLGLPIAKTIIEKHNGNIMAQNAEHFGAQFIITLPLSGGLS